MREGFWEGSTGNSDFEDFVSLDAGVLGVDYVGSEGGREGIDVGEGEEVGLFTHRESFSWWDLAIDEQF